MIGRGVLSVRSMLVIHQGALGDFILALPSLEMLRKRFPQARIVFMGYPRILELIEGRFYAEEILSIDQKGMASFFMREGILDPQLSQIFKSFDLIVVFGKDGESPLMKNLKRLNGGEPFHIACLPGPNERIHLGSHFVRELARYGLSSSAGEVPKLYLRESDQEWATAYWLDQGVAVEDLLKVILIHPGSGSTKKVWPIDRFLDLIRVLRRRFDSKTVIILGPAEGQEIRRAFEIAGGGTFIFLHGLSLIQLASAIRGCRLFIGNDSGVSHLAAALEIPTVALFGPTDPEIWSPRGKKVVTIRRKIQCSPCSRERCSQCQHLECLNAIQVEDVVEGIGRALAT